MANVSRPSGSRPMSRPGSSRLGVRPGGGVPGRFKKSFAKKKVCRFCADKVEYIDFKNVNLLRNFITERGKITSSRITGVCSPHQRKLTSAIKLARNIALMPFSVI